MKSKTIIKGLFVFLLSFLVWSSQLVLAAPSPFAGGDGLTSETAFQITTCEQLQDMNYSYDEGVTYPFLTSNYYFVLNNDIDCAGTVDWNDGAGFMPIGYTMDNINEISSGAYFNGNFNGNNYTILNLFINRPTFIFVGLFGGANESEITNVGLIDVNLTGLDSVGGLVGNNVNGVINNSYTTGIIKAYLEASEGGNGGLIGVSTGGLIENTYSEVSVEGAVAGGLIGTGGGVQINNSYSTGNVLGSIAGGLIAFAPIVNIGNSYSVSDITGYPSEFTNMMISVLGIQNIDLPYITGGFIGVISGNSEEIESLLNNSIQNSSWSKSDNNQSQHAIGGAYIQIPDGEGLLTVYQQDIDNPLTIIANSSDLYSKDNQVYALGQDGGWVFGGNPWYEYTNDFPKFTEPQNVPAPTRPRTRSTGSSVGAMSSFYQDQLNRAIAIGADTTPYIQALNQFPSTPNTSTPETIERILKQGMTGEDVKALQVYLNTHGYPVSLTGAGSLGNETNYFGLKTKQAVVKFQLANGLVGDGVVGKMTREKIK